MSASREKKKRQETKSDTPVLSAKERQRRKDSLRRTIGITVAVVIILGLFLLIFTGSGIPQANFTAVTLGDIKVTSAEYDYYYFLNYYQTVPLYAQYGLIDPEIPLNRQDYPGEGDMNWEEYLDERTTSTIQTFIALSEQAKAEGVTLTDEDIALIETDIASLHTAAEENGTEPEKYLRQNYGRGLSLESYREMLERRFLAIRYQTVKTDSFNHGETEITDYYNENKDTYDTIDYHIFNFSLTPPARDEGDYTEDELEAYKADQKKKAEDMLSRVTTGDAFKALSLEYTEPEKTDDTGDDTDDTEEDDTDDAEETEEEETDDTLISVNASSVTEGVLSEYLLDESRKEGDKTVLEDTDALRVVLYQKRSRDEEKTVDVRHILISFDDYDDNAAAKARAEEIYQEWKDGDATEDSFADLAKTHSSDGNSALGGIYENVYKGQMVEPYETWCFDPARKPGDTGIVETEYGFHIMYFVGDGMIKWMLDVKTDMDTEEYDTWLTTHLESYPIKKNWLGMIFTKTTA